MSGLSDDAVALLEANVAKSKSLLLVSLLLQYKHEISNAKTGCVDQAKDEKSVYIVTAVGVSLQF